MIPGNCACAGTGAVAQSLECGIRLKEKIIKNRKDSPMRKMMRKGIVQEDATGCGIACAAMLAGKTYHATKKQAKELGLFADDRSLYSDIYHLRPLLASYNIRIGRKEPFRNWKEVPSPAILAIKYRPDPDYPFWHWAVFRQEESGPVVLDPSRKRHGRGRTDLGNIKPQWFIPVRPNSTDS